MPKKILLTRPKSASEKLSWILAQRGFEVIVEPLMVIEPIAVGKPEGEFDAVMITSANLFEVLGDKQWVRGCFSLPCFCVGETTGAAAQKFGFQHIRCGVSDSVAMAQFIISENTGVKNILHLCGDIMDEKVKNILQDARINLTQCSVYHARAVEGFSKLTRTALQDGSISIIPLFSPRSAKILVSILKKNGLTSCCSSITVVSLSQAVADVLNDIKWRRVFVAAAPSEQEVLICIGNITHDTDGNAA